MTHVPLDYFDTNRLNILKQRWIESPEPSVQVTWGNESYVLNGYSHQWDIDLITPTFEEKVGKMDGVNIYHFSGSIIVRYHKIKSPFT